jgi:large subunit ribosomal protein L2
MAIKTLNPTTPGTRGMTTQDFDSITAKKPVKSLTRIKKGSVGRNNQGRITTRHRGGGVRRYYRLVNFKLAAGTTATIEAIEYDPNRSARIARLKDTTGEYHYIIAAGGMAVGQTIVSGEETAVETGNRMPLKNIPTGATIYAIELQPGRGAQLVRSAGNGAQLLAKEGDYAQVKLPSGEVRKDQHQLFCSHMETVGNVTASECQRLVRLDETVVKAYAQLCVVLL